MFKTSWIIFLYLVLCTVAACSCNRYCGDGYLLDRWYELREYHYRYRLDLGNVDLQKTGTYSYTLQNIPHTPFTLGLEIIAINKNTQVALFDSRPLNPKLKILLTDSKDGIVINEVEELKKWVWSGFSDQKNRSFVFLHRNNAGGDSRFIPKSNEKYRLIFEILEADKQSVAYNVKLMGQG